MTYLRRDTYHTSRAQAEMDELAEPVEQTDEGADDQQEPALMCPSTQKT